VQRRSWKFRPGAEAVEGRLLLSVGASSLPSGALGPGGFLHNPPGSQAVRPNTPVLPFGAPLTTATFVDPTAIINNGKHVVIGQKSYVGPFAWLDTTTGFIKIGSGSAVLDNAHITANPSHAIRWPTSVFIGDQVSIGYGATVLGQSTIGAYGAAAKPTGIAANALIDNATIEPGAVVGVLARVGPGVTVPAGMYVLPGGNVTTDAEASDPALGKVEPLPASVLSDLTTNLTRDAQLAAGYTNLYQGNSATGVNPGVDPSVTPGIYNGNLATVLGTSQEPGPTSTSAATGITFEPSKTGPKFPGPYKAQVESLLSSFPGRIVGDARFTVRANLVAQHLGPRTAIRADQGQPIKFAGPPITGRSVTINAPLGGSITSGGVTKVVGAMNIGQNFVAQNGAVILGGPAASYTIGDNVTVGSSAVVDRSTVGAGATIGARSVVLDSNVAAGQSIPPGTLLIHDKVVGQIQW
jgi:carbonic anhydrase/acetyltransferase-like protein (isoleucine patch superfamily)